MKFNTKIHWFLCRHLRQDTVELSAKILLMETTKAYNRVSVYQKKQVDSKFRQHQDL